MTDSRWNLQIVKIGRTWQKTLEGAFLLVVLFAWPSLAETVPQVVINTNSGDRLSGRLVSVTAERVELETTYAGRIVIRAAEIKKWQASEEAARQQLAVALLKKPVLKLEPKAEAKFLASNKPEPKKAAAAVKAEPWQRGLNFAYTFTRGNADVSDLVAALSLARKRGTLRASFNGMGRYSVRNGAQIAHLLTANVRLDEQLAKLPAFSETLFEVDRIKRLDYRISQNIGVSYPVWNREGRRMQLDFGTGVMRESFNNGATNLAAASLLRAKAEQKIKGKAQFNQELTLFSDLARPANYRMQTDLSLTMPLNKHMGFRLAGLNRYDNRPVAANIKRNDFSLLTGFTFTF